MRRAGWLFGRPVVSFAALEMHARGPHIPQPQKLFNDGTQDE
jgi:hypothetical protein